MTVGDVRSLWGPLWAHLSPIASPGLSCLGSQEEGGNRPSAGVDVQPGLWLPHPFQESWRGGRDRPRLAWSSGLIFPASIDPAASPESISSRRVKISPIVSPDLRQGGIHSNLFKQRKAVPSDLYSNLFQAGRGSGWGGGKPWHSGAGPRPGRQPPCQPGWQLVLPMAPGGGGPQQGGGKRGPPAFPAGPAWLERSVVDLVFTKYKAAHLEPLSQALGTVPGMRSPAAPVPGWGLGWAQGPSGPSWAEWQGAYSSPGAPTPQPAFQEQSCSGSEGTCTPEKLLCGREPLTQSPSPREPQAHLHDAVRMPGSWSEQIGAPWCPNQEVSFELTFTKYLLCAGRWASAAKYLALAESSLPRVPQFLR